MMLISGIQFGSKRLLIWTTALVTLSIMTYDPSRAKKAVAGLLLAKFVAALVV